MGFSIFVLFYVKNDLLYLIPVFGAIALLFEAMTTISCFKAKEPISWFSLVFFIYISTIVTCIWLLEVENIKAIRLGEMKKDYNLINYKYFGKKVYGSIQQVIGDIKIVWSQLEIQIFLALVMIIRWILPSKNLSPHGLNDLLFRYFGISCDMLDFLAIIQDPILIKSDDIIYSCLAVWTWSTFQFFIYVPKYENEEKREFSGYITNSLLMVFFLDLPYFCVRMAAIFAYGAHNYNSYFFAIKNLVMMFLQIARIKATFSERSLRHNRNIKKLNGKIGFDQDKEQDLYNRELDIIAINNFEQRSKNASNSSIPQNAYKTSNFENSADSEMNSYSSTPVRTPKISEQRFKGSESNTSIPLLNQKPITFEEQKSRNASNCSTPVNYQKQLSFTPTTKINYFAPQPLPAPIQKPMGMPITQRLTDF